MRTPETVARIAPRRPRGLRVMPARRFTIVFLPQGLRSLTWTPSGPCGSPRGFAHRIARVAYRVLERLAEALLAAVRERKRSGN
jgi:hypothetical protein